MSHRDSIVMHNYGVHVWGTTQDAVCVALCGYEIVALTTRAVPTITALDRRHPIIGGALIAALALHFWQPRLMARIAGRAVQAAADTISDTIEENLS